MPTNTLHVTWGDRIRRLRIHHGLDQRALASLLGVSPAAVGQWERGDHTPRTHRLIEDAVEVRLGRESAEFLREFDVKPTGYGSGVSGVSGVSVLWARFRPGRAA